MTRSTIFAGSAAMLLGGCIGAIAENEVRSELLDAGLSEGDADCMAERLVDRLSIGQLRKLEGLGPEEGEEPIPRTLSEFVERVRRVDDLEVVGVATSSAALCASGLANEAQ